MDELNLTQTVGGLRAAKSALEGALVSVNEALPQIKKKALPSVLRSFHQLQSAYDDADDVRKEIGKLIEQLSRGTIPEMMDEQDVKTMTIEIADGIKFRFTVNQRMSCSMPDKTFGFQWLRDNGHGDIIQETVNSNTLASFAKTYQSDTGKDLPAEGFKVSTSLYTSVTKV